MAPKEFQDRCLNLIATIATDNTMVVAYLRRRGGGGGGKFGPICALLWRILTWCSRKNSQARHIHALTISRPEIHCVKTQCLVTSLLLVLEVWDGVPTYRKSRAGNLLVWSDLTLGLGPLLQGHMRIAKLKSAYNLLIIDPRGLQCETNSYKILG